MKTYHKNGTISEMNYILEENEEFAIQDNTTVGQNQFFYPGDTLVRKLDLELVNLSDKFVDLYFPDIDLYYMEKLALPIGLSGGHSSEIPINKNDFLALVNQTLPYCGDIYRHVYVEDCQYLVCTVQNLLLSAEHCYLQYYIEISRIDSDHLELGETLVISSPETMRLMFYLETFFIKLYSVLDLIVKIIYELEHPRQSFNTITKLKSAEKLWGDRKKLHMIKCIGTVFEDCETIKIIESLRNEAVHNGTWEFYPKVFLKIKDKKIVERYMLFPDIIDGRLSSAKNRKHFFSTETKVNDKLVQIHDDFYKRLFTTLQQIDQNINYTNKQGVPS